MREAQDYYSVGGASIIFWRCSQSIGLASVSTTCVSGWVKHASSALTDGSTARITRVDRWFHPLTQVVLT